jgi:hypothetical protein
VSLEQPAPPPADERDWTVVLDTVCPECGFDAAAITGADVPAAIPAVRLAFGAALAAPTAARRPEPLVWSALEYGAHVRDVCRIFDTRLQLMLTEHDPLFANWDQDTTAIEDQYWAQVPSVVAAELDQAAAAITTRIAGVSGAQWQRPGRRSNGSVFTVDTISRYFLHDLVHHAYDIGAPVAGADGITRL